MRRVFALGVLVLSGSLLAQEAKVAVPPPPPPAAAINLARTSIAAVGASGVNGHRELNNEFYGIQKAFDEGGKARADGILYNYWLAEAGDTRPWVVVEFDVPVEVERVVAMGAPAFRVEFKWKEAFEFAGKGDGAVKLEKPAAGVKAVRITFEPGAEATGPVRVDEIQVLGRVPADAKVTVGEPRMMVSAAFAGKSAEVVFNEWKFGLVGNAKPKTEETGEAFVTTYFNGEMAVARVRVRKSDGAATIEPLVKLVPATDAGGQD